jgi:hypothetical protein
MGFLRRLMAYYQKFSHQPPKIFVFGAYFLDNLKTITNRGFETNFVRFYGANILQPESEVAIDELYPPIELLFVTASKDFPTLRIAVSAAIDACILHKTVEVSVVVPQQNLEECKVLLPQHVRVIPETVYLSEGEIDLLKKRFGKRYGWVLQQVVKVRHVVNSKSQGVLVVDSDTLLLKARFWFDESGKQLLAPTWEYHPEYYRFLSSHGIGTIKPQYTFVPHHMLMQPMILREALLKANWLSENYLLSALLNDSDKNDNSPFCIEYELYAQYLISTYPHLVVLRKWSNLSVARDSLNPVGASAEKIANNYKDYYSVSLHDYL